MRIFVALELEDIVKARLRAVQEALAPVCPGVRWIPAEQIHLTVKFLGEVADKVVTGVLGAVEASAKATCPFQVQIAGCGCFPPGGAVRIVWAGASEPTGVLGRFVEAAEAAVEPLGFPRERRPFSPHLTIGRVREDKSRGGVRSAVSTHVFPAIVQPLESVTVMQSVLSPKGPRYVPIRQIAFGPVADIPADRPTGEKPHESRR